MIRHLLLPVFLLFTTLLFAQNQARLGLALSGGGAKGLAHIGVIEELEKAGIYADVVSGTSMGSIVGGLYSIGYTPKQLRSVASDIKWSDYFSDSYPSIFVPIEQRRISRGYQLSFPIDSSGLVLPRGVLQGKKIQTLLSLLFAPAQHSPSFDDFQRPFRAVATDMEDGSAYVFDKGTAYKAIRASMAIPSVFAPVTVIDDEGKERLLVDGLVVRNLPTQEALDLGADFVLAVDVGAPLAKAKDLNNLINILQQTTDFGSIKLNDEQRELADAIIDPDLGEFSAISYDASDSIVALGAASARLEMPRIIKTLEAAGFSIPMKKPEHKAIVRDSFHVTAVHFKSDDPATKVILKKLFKLKIPGQLTNKQLEKQINQLYGSKFFQSVDFHFVPNAEGSDLVITAAPVQKWHMGVGAAYDSDYEPALLVNLSGRNVIGNGSLLSLDARISEFPRASIQYLLYTQTRPSIGVHLNADANFYPGRLYENNDLAAEYRAHHFRSRLGAFSGLGENRYLEIGVLSESLSSNDLFISLESNNNVLNRQAVYLEFIQDSYDRALFPRKGSRTNFNVLRSFSGRERLANTDFQGLGDNLVLTARHNRIIPFAKKLVGILDLASGFVQHKRRNILNQLYLGRPLPTEPFFFNAYGRRHMETPVSGFLSGAFGLRAEFGNDYFVGLHYQYGRYSILDSRLLLFGETLLNPDREDHDFQGLGLVLGLNTFLGPFQFNAEYNPELGSTNFNLHLGYYF